MSPGRQFNHSFQNTPADYVAAIVEQATHMCECNFSQSRVSDVLLGDLSRSFAPAVDLDSVQVHTIEHSDPVGHLSELRIDGGVKPENKIPRMTNAIWRYENGAMGSLLHGICIHGERPRNTPSSTMGI